MPQINFDLSAGRDAVDVRWSADFDGNVFHLKLHQNGTRGDSNPCVIYLHSGGANQNDAKMPFVATDTIPSSGNFVFYSLLNSTRNNWVCVSANMQQNSFALNDSDYATGGIRRVDAYANAHSQANVPWHQPNDNEPVTAGAMFDQLKMFILVLKSRASEYGIDPNRIFLMGSSYGAVRAILSQLSGPIYSNELTKTFRTQFGIKPGFDSTVCGIINHFGCPDFRLNTPTMGVFDGSTGTNAGKSINNTFYTNRYVGVFTTKQLAALPAWHTEQLSLLWYMEQKHENLKYLPPVYHFYEFIGQEYSRKFVPSQTVSISNGGSGFVSGDVGKLISAPASAGRGSERVKFRIAAVSGGAVTGLTIANSDTYTGSYRILPGQQRNATTGGFLSTFDNITCAYDGVGGTYLINGVPTAVPDTCSATGAGLVVKLEGLAVQFDAKTSNSYNGGYMWPAADPHDDVLMRMIQYTHQQSRCGVSFRYTTALDTEVTDQPGFAALKTKQIGIAADMELWMESVIRNKPMTGPSAYYYGDYYYPDSIGSIPSGWNSPVDAQTWLSCPAINTVRKVTYPFPTNWYI